MCLPRRALRCAIVAILVSSAAAATLVAEPARAAKRPITYEVYDEWRSIRDTTLSRDGVWLAYTLAPQDGDSELVVRNLTTDMERRHARGKEPYVTSDSRFVIFTVAPSKTDVDRAKKQKRSLADQPKSGLGILDLTSGRVVTVDRVKNFKLPNYSGRYAAYLKEPDTRPSEASTDGKGRPNTRPKQKEVGSDLVIRVLATGEEAIIPEVVEYAWSKDGSWVAYAVSSRTPAKGGAFVWRAMDRSVRALLAGAGRYKAFAFDERSSQLAFMSDRDEYGADAPGFSLYHWTAPAPSATELVSATTTGMPAGFSVSENGHLKFSNDGARLFISTAPRPKAESADGPEPVKVDIWHWRDPLLQTMQKVVADDDRKLGYRAVMHLKDRRFAQLASTDMPNVDILNGDAPYALGSSNVPYRPLLSWDGLYEDLYLVDVRDGSRRQIVKQARFGWIEEMPREGKIATLSPAGKYVLWFDQREADWFSLRVSDGHKTNLTEGAGVKFENEVWNTAELPRSYGFAGWTPDDRSVLLYDRYDIWEIQAEGQSARMVTNGLGRRERLVFRYEKLDPNQTVIRTEQPILISAVADVTKASGFYRTRPGGASDPVKAVMLDKAFGPPVKAKDADTLVVTASRFDEFPNLWVTDGSFAKLRQVSDANPQQSEFIWGYAELIDYINADGKPLRAVLIKPEDFDPRKKYPLMVNMYEVLTNRLHQYVPPAPSTSVNLTHYVSNGYIVLMPDIVYDIGYPGESALKCVVPAVQEVLRMGFVDPARIGLQGHSWGGYQISYMVTRTDIFRAVEAGAAVVNMVSAYGGLRWGMGMSRAFQYEKATSRIGGPPWERPLQFIENSPIFWVDKVTTPYLTIHNDEDGAVPWHQGIEFFSALRRLGKEAYLFNYNGDGHSLRDRQNQKHWTIHMAEFFDHHLKDAPRPEWMEKGVPFLTRGTRDLSTLFKTTTDNKQQ